MYSYYISYVLLVVAMLFAAGAQSKVSRTFSRYSRVRNSSGMTGAQAARRVLDSNGLNDVRIGQISGKLTDNYNPKDRTLYLSSGVYAVDSVGAVSVACHEAGHAIQHANGYAPLKIRNSIVPLVNFASNLTWPLIIVGIILLSVGSGEYGYIGNLVFNIGIYTFLAVIAFHLITLPVEFNASHRALKQMTELSIVSPEDLVGSRKVLHAAAMTYVAALAVAFANLLRLLAIRGRN